MADKVFVSPGVYTSERDLSFVGSKCWCNYIRYRW